MKTLDKMTAGEIAYMVDYQSNRLCIALFEQGCFPGDKIHMLENAPDDNSLLFAHGKKRFRIYRKEARAVVIHCINYQFCLN